MVADRMGDPELERTLGGGGSLGLDVLVDVSSDLEAGPREVASARAVPA